MNTKMEHQPIASLIVIDQLSACLATCKTDLKFQLDTNFIACDLQSAEWTVHA